jgi:excisionase family DNA binding protein
MMKGYLTTKEAAERLKISDTRVRQMIIEGVIVGAEKFGRENVVPESEVVRLAQTERKPGRPPKVKWLQIKFNSPKSKALATETKEYLSLAIDLNISEMNILERDDQNILEVKFQTPISSAMVSNLTHSLRVSGIQANFDIVART